MITKRTVICLAIAGSLPALTVAANDTAVEEIIITERLFRDTTLVSPTSTITAEDLQAINIVTTEDAVAYEPSLVIRRRFIGDPNGTMGIRGSGMFQTARSMVFADGLPLHYLLQTRWSGSPRWSLLAPDEIAKAEVIYGPYSAEYSGNAMGGVVNITTRDPQERRFTLQGNTFTQQYDELGTDDDFNGGKLYGGYEDKIGDLRISTSINHLQNKSQPMSNYMVDAQEQEELDAAGVTGYIKGKDSHGKDVLYIGDSGGEKATSDLYRLKLSYDFDSVQLRGTAAYEDRDRDEDDKNNYLRDSNGDIYWGTGNRNFEERSQNRESLLLGLGLSGNATDSWFYDIYATDFDIIKDKETRSGLDTNDPAFGSRDGRVTEHGDTGWQTFDAKIGTESLFDNDAMRLSLGYYVDSYKLEIESSNIDATTGDLISDRPGSGGKTSTQALFAQWGLEIGSQWDLALGLRYEEWESNDGYLGDEKYKDRDEDGLSPKLSLAFMPSDSFSARYSVAKAYRFPIVEELYSNENRTSSIIVSDPSLKPEEGVHHNLTFNQNIENGFVRVNLFYEKIDDSIYYQSGTIIDDGINVNVSTFLAIDEVETKGVELIYNQERVLDSNLGLRFNTSYTDAEITKNSVNPDIEGNDMPRIPEWRANLIVSYAMTDSLDVSSSFRYADNAYGDIDNSDRENKVYGAIDSYFFVNAKANWRVADNTSVAIGVDNIFDDLAYVAHPWPSRTFYLEGKLSF